MKRSWKWFFSGVFTAVLVFALIGTAAAKIGNQTAQLEYNNIKVTLDGKQVDLVDANGDPVEPFGISGTTYLPIRAISSALGLNVDWNGDTKTVVLTTGSTEQKPVDGATLSQQNALRKANSYLDFMAFSRQGLIEQLEHEGFSTEDAVFAVDNCGADWNEQAAKKAQDYLDFMAFSRDGLIEQLLYEGFTQEQAEYGVSQVGY